ncbi:MAG: hypothetical protein VYC34_10480, partial [Planctomycetota bacterium]|nr:hypothetical protein [Planctomycetota bacterium]
PPVDLARFTAMQTLTRIANEFARLTQFLQQAQSQLPNLDQAIASRLRGAAQASAAVRDEAATGMDELSRLQTPDAVLVARVIERGPAAVVVSPSGATAVRFESLFPSRQVIEAAGGTTADLGFVGEELLATSIASLNNPVNPIVAFVHAQPGRLLDRAGRPAADDVARLFGALLDRLRLRGVSAVEWPVAIEDQPSALFELDPTGARPVVWVTLGVAATTAEGAGRMGRLANAVNQLVGDGESVLLSIEPSTLPAVGESDPMTEAAALLGMNIRSGRVVLERFSRPSGAVVSPGQTIVPRAGAHPVANAIEGLSTLVPWPVPIELTEVEGVETWEILSIEDSADRWAESQWLEFKALPAAQRGMVTDPPSPNPSRDDVDGPWIVAAVAERAVEGRDQPQRFAAVGSNGWFFDEFTQQTTVIDGRTVAVVPGNAELFEALVSWLAGQDDLIAPSPRVRDVSRIAALSGAQMAAIRWMLIAGAPLLILLTGAAVRLIRN